MTAPDCLIGLETAHNLLLDYLWDHGYKQIYVIPPRVVKSSRGRYGQSAARDDTLDGQTYRRDIIVSTEYDGLGRATCVTAPKDVETFDTRISWPTESAFISDDCESEDHASTTYDALSRRLNVTDPSGALTTTQYDIPNNTIVNGVSSLHRQRITDPNDHMVIRFYDAHGQLVKTREHTGTVDVNLTSYADTEYTYDWKGNLTKVENKLPDQYGGGQIKSSTVITYDVLSRKTEMDDADMGVWDYEYDAVGNLIRQTDAMTQVICLYYDTLGRSIQKEIDPIPGDACPVNPSPAGGSNHLASYTYDTATNGVGMIASVVWDTGLGNHGDWFHYDTEGRLYEQTRKLDGRSYTLTTLSFDPLDRPLQIRHPDNELVTYTYDREGEETLAAGLTYLVDGVTYNDRGQRALLERGSGVDSVFTYYGMSGGQDGNNNGRLQNLWHGTTSADYADYTYQYDEVGNITQIYTDWILDTITDTQDYAYDELNRLLFAEGESNSAITDFTHDYAYNEIGNIMSFEGDTFECLDADHTHALTHIDAIQRFIYDANGNMTWRGDPFGVNVYTQTFDIQNRLTEVEHSGGTVTEFAYTDGEQRVKTQVEVAEDTRTTTYFPFPNYEEGVQEEWQCGWVYRGKVPIWRCEWVTLATIERSSYFFGGEVVAVRVSEDPVPANNGLFYLFTDHLGSTNFLTDSTGQQIGDTIRHYPYGEYRTAPSTGAITDRGYTSHRHDDSLGLVYMNARFYLQGTGRFLSADTIVPDPMNPQQYNRYSYVRNNPIRFMDPSGHWDCESSTDCRFPETPSLPNHRYLYSPTYGWLDTDHFATGAPSDVISQVSSAISGSDDPIVAHQGVKGGIVEYYAYYTVSDNASEEEVHGIAFGIYMDWSIRFEDWQGDLLFGLAEIFSDTSFAIEDLGSAPKGNKYCFQLDNIVLEYYEGGYRIKSWEFKCESEGLCYECQ